jgi:predicted GTPase
MADIIIVSKVNTAETKDVKQIKQNVRKINSDAVIIDANIVITSEDEEKLIGKKVLVIEDGPTLTHGEMKFGAATIKAKEMGAIIIDPRPYAKGTIKEVYDLWPHLGEILPAVGYSEHQMKEFEESINSVPCDIVLMGTPTDLRRYLEVDKPVLRVRYEYNEVEPGSLIAELENTIP